MTDLDPALGPPSQELNLLGVEVFAADHGRRAVILLQSFIDDEAAGAEVLGHRRPGIGSRVLNVGIVHPAVGEGEIRLDRLAGVGGIAHDEAADDIQAFAVQVLDGREGGVGGPAVRVHAVLGSGAEEVEVVVQDVLDPEEDVVGPLATGSPTPAKTIGRVLVACLAARAWGVPPATITSTLSATSSAARAAASGTPSRLTLTVWRKAAAVHYSITWSARSRSDGGIVSPSALAVFKLMTK
jgi:hypothetical protein